MATFGRSVQPISASREKHNGRDDEKALHNEGYRVKMGAGLTPTGTSAANLYLDLLKLCLTDSIFIDDPLSRVIPYEPKSEMALPKRLLVHWLQAFLRRYRIFLVETYSTEWLGAYSDLPIEKIRQLRESGGDWPVRAHTMIGLRRLNNLQLCIETVIADRVPGDLIETGVWRGGAAIFMRGALKALGEAGRTVWAADSFRGLPPPNERDYPADAGDRHHSFRQLAISRAEVENNFRRYGLLDGQVKFLEGWFKDTLPTAPIERLAVLRLDGDMYESTIQTLDALYAKLSPGGFAIIDDYHIPGCRAATDDFRRDHSIFEPLEEIDEMAVFWRKSSG